VIEDEGSHSCKAIAFINSKGNIRLKTKSYFELCMSPQKTAILPNNIELTTKMDPDVKSTKRIGE